MEPIPPPPRRSRGVRIYLIVATALFGLSLLPAAMAALMSPMAFDAGESREAWTFVLLVWAYPVLVILGLLAAWILYAARAYRTAIAASLLPLLDGAALAALFMIWG
ncbi:MAG TPA: hypothetical protein VIC28_12630 [Thermoanaerobaculia bacterium]|jgi:hypothetical protein